MRGESDRSRSGDNERANYDLSILTLYEPVEWIWMRGPYPAFLLSINSSLSFWNSCEGLTCLTADSSYIFTSNGSCNEEG